MKLAEDPGKGDFMQDIFGEQLRVRQNELHKIIDDKRNALVDAPEGRLRCKNNHERNEYYLIVKRGDTTGHDLLADQAELVKKLAQKQYDQKILETAEGEFKRIRALEKYRSAHPLETIHDRYCPSRRELVDPLFMSDEEYISWWLNRKPEWPALGFDKDFPSYYTKKNLRVRSKSEIFLANRLDDFLLPFIFEFPIYLEGRGWVHPDFTILNIRLRKVYIWEHLGKMDDPGYVQDNLSKIRAYERSGYFLGDNLILTFETKTLPLDTREVDQIIRHFLL